MSKIADTLDYAAPETFLEFPGADVYRAYPEISEDTFLNSAYLSAWFYLDAADKRTIRMAQPAVYIPKGGDCRYPGSEYTYAFIPGFQPVRLNVSNVRAALKKSWLLTRVHSLSIQ